MFYGVPHTGLTIFHAETSMNFMKITLFPSRATVIQGPFEPAGVPDDGVDK
jgi:hypothetical protein